MLRLSSPFLSILNRFLLPIPVVCGTLVVAFGSHGGERYLLAGICVAASIGLLWWSLPIKEVWYRDGHFVISNYVREVTVPASHLSHIDESSMNRTPNILMFFNPPLPFGKKVRLIPPLGEFEEKAALLRDLLRTKKA